MVKCTPILAQKPSVYRSWSLLIYFQLEILFFFNGKSTWSRNFIFNIEFGDSIALLYVELDLLVLLSGKSFFAVKIALLSQ